MSDRSTNRTGYPLTIPDSLLNSDAMRQACATRNWSEIFRLVNRRTGSSYADMAAAVGKMTSSRVGDIVRGARGVRAQRVIERICDGFGIPGEMLGVPERTWERGSPSDIHTTTNGENNLTSVSDPELDERAQYAERNPGGVDLVTVAGLRQQVQRLDGRYATEPSAALIAETGRRLGQLVQWQNHNIPYPVRRDVHAAMAEASTLMGQLVWDASGRTDNATARSYFGQAARAAQQSNDSVSEGLALLRTSFVALYGEKDPCAGLELAQKTCATVKYASHVLSGLAVLHAAEAHAMLHQRRECEKALRSAEQHFERMDSNDPGGAMLSPGQFGRLAGSCFLSLNDTAHAQAVLEQTLTEVRAGSKSHAIVLGNLALTHVRQRDVDKAVDALEKAVCIIENHRGGGGLNLVFQAGRELQEWRNLAAVRDLNDRLFSLIAAV